MEDFDDFSQEDTPEAQDGPGVPLLMLAPAVLRIVIAGKNLDTELDALVEAVGIVKSPDRFMRDFIFEIAAELAQAVEEIGIVGLAAQAKDSLTPDELALAVRIGLVAVFSSPKGGDGDIGILAAIAEQLGLSEDDFTRIYDSAQRTLAGG